MPNNLVHARQQDDKSSTAEQDRREFRVQMQQVVELKPDTVN